MDIRISLFLTLFFFNLISPQEEKKSIWGFISYANTKAMQVLNFGLDFINSNLEFCNSGSVPYNISGLERNLRDNVFGQPIVNHLVANSLKMHTRRKALALSFNGRVGCGKNYVTSFIMKSLFARGASSKFVKFYSGRNHFPYASRVEEYRDQLRDDILGLVKSCGRALIIFDEVDKMPEGILDALVPFLDYNGRNGDVDFREAVFIFISNTAGRQIAERTLELFKKGKTRNDLVSRDFEDILSNNALTGTGGLHMSDIINLHLIDHFVPFLPLERQHVIMCIQEEIINYFSQTHKGTVVERPDIIREVLEDVQFDYELEEIFAYSGCKRLNQKAAVALGRSSWDFKEPRVGIEEL